MKMHIYDSSSSKAHKKTDWKIMSVKIDFLLENAIVSLLRHSYFYFALRALAIIEMH